MQRILTAVVGALAISAAYTAHATHITLGTTANPAPAAVYLADQQGFFKKNGLDLGVQIVSTDSTIPAALVSGSVQLASVTPTTFLSAVANGLDLVALTGTAVTTHESKDVAIVARKAEGITDATGFAGKTLGVPSIGSVLDVMLRVWLRQHGIDAAKIKFIEIPFPQQANQLRAGNIDGVITVNQFAGPMIGQGFGQLISSPLSELPEGLTAQEIVSTRAWATSHKAEVAALRKSLSEAQAMAKTNPAMVRAALGQAMRLPPPVTAHIALPAIDTSLTAEQLDWWGKVMKQQGLLKTEVDTSKLIQP